MMDQAFLQAEAAYLEPPEYCEWCGFEWCQCEREEES